jgi:hypothetical protein
VRSGSISIILFFLVFMSFSCKEKGSRNINQGEIHYAIDYIGNLGDLPKEVLPQNLIVYFKKDKLLFEMLSTFGNSGIINLTNPDEGIFDTYFSLFTMKYYYAAEKGELFPGFEGMEGMELKKTSLTTQICGFNCKNAEITFPPDRSKVLRVWYTNEIDVKNSNISTPFKDIDGVLMDFFFYLGKTEVHFTAENVYNKDIDDATFTRRDDFKRVSREEINKFIGRMTSL